MKRALIDLSSVLWTALLGGKDAEFGKTVVIEAGKTVHVNSATHGLEGVMGFMQIVMDDLKVTPHQIIFVAEGMNAKAERQAFHPAYKVGREKVPEQYEEFNKLKALVLDAFCDVGAQACWQDGGVEGDDVLGYLADHLQGRKTIVSGDKDLAVKVDPAKGIHHWRAGVLDENPFGKFSHKLITTYIAMVGDASDKIPGARGFGEVAARKFISIYGEPGLQEVERLILAQSLRTLEDDGDTAAFKPLQKVVDDSVGVYMSYELARLRIASVNTMANPLQWRVGMVKPRHANTDYRLRKYAGVQRIVTQEQYTPETLAWFDKQFKASPYVSLDVETTTPQESDDWLASREKEDKIDVFGSTLTSLQLTFGDNLQYSVYLPVDNANTANLSIAQVVAICDMIPQEKITYVHNAAFELPVCYTAWAGAWSADPVYHGFLRNIRDTRIGSSYVDENRSQGLKSLSATLLGYEQVNYDTVTTIDGVQYKMDALSAEHVLSYGCDDTICTAALANHFRVVMELENTWEVYEAVETFPAYLTALAYVQGTAFSLQSMREQEKDDDVAYDAAWEVLRTYLMAIGYAGTRFEPLEVLDRASIIRACLDVTGVELKTMVRTPSKLAMMVADVEGGALLATFIERGDLASINQLLEARFVGHPRLDLASSKQMSALLYDRMGLPVRCINDATDKQAADVPGLDKALRKFKKKQNGDKLVIMSPEELALVRTKARADDTSIALAVAFDTDYLNDADKAALKAIGTMKKVSTRRSLFYGNYRRGQHWKDGKIHSSMNQCGAVTRRYSSSDPNLQQLPKKNEGVRFRSHFLPHKKNAVVMSLDFAGQELRLAAWESQDKNMMACYVGENLKDIHGLTSAGAMRLKWGAAQVTELHNRYGHDLSRNDEDTYKLFVRIHNMGKATQWGKTADDLRKAAKNVNFGAQNGAKGSKLAETLIMSYEDAAIFLEARSAMFPDVDVAAERIAQETKRRGFATTFLGARRHLSQYINSDERGAADRAARQAWNFRIQGSAGEQTKLAMAEMWKRGIYFRYDAQFIAPIHDEGVSSVHRDDAVEFAREKNECMTIPYAGMKIPVLAAISLGPNFAEQHECGEKFDRAGVEWGLTKTFGEKVAA